LRLRNILLFLAIGSLSLSVTAVAQEAQPAKPAAAQSTNTKVMKTVLCHDVKEREPQEEMTAAKVGDIVVGWMQIQSSEDTTVTHRWMRDGETISDVTLNVKTSPSYRAWSRKTIGSPGSWKWQILDSNGTVLKEVAFTAAGS